MLSRCLVIASMYWAASCHASACPGGRHTAIGHRLPAASVIDRPQAFQECPDDTMTFARNLPIVSPDLPGQESFHDAGKAVARLRVLYDGATRFLCDHFIEALKSGEPEEVPGLLPRGAP